jgi:hypothetical protein
MHDALKTVVHRIPKPQNTQQDGGAMQSQGCCCVRTDGSYLHSKQSEPWPCSGRRGLHGVLRTPPKKAGKV